VYPVPGAKKSYSYPPHKRAWQLVTAPSAPVMKVKRHISLREAERLIAAGSAEPVYDDANAEIIGFRLKDRETVRAAIAGPVKTFCRPDVGSDASTATLNENECDLVVGQAFEDGKSRTLTMTAEQIESRAVRFLRGEDFVHLAQVKLDAFRPRYRA
jgi:hypothetical protein